MLSKDLFTKLSEEQMYEAYVKSFTESMELKEDLGQLKTAVDKIEEDHKRIEKLESEVIICRQVNEKLRKALNNIKKEIDDTNDLI